LTWQEEAKELKFSEGKSWDEITDLLLPKYWPDEKWSKIKERIRSPFRERKPLDDRPVGVFGDPHIPFDHPGYLPFLVDTFKQYKVGQVVCVGDMVDHHAMSRHETETCAKSALDELDMAIETVAKYTKAFPKVKWCTGNHDTIPERQAATVGIDKRYLKALPEVLQIPKTWETSEEFIIDDVLYKHGINCTGKDGAINTAIQERMSTVIGHSHAFGGCKYSANKRDIIFGLNAGCGIDIAAYAFAYGKNAKFRPTLGCGIVFNNGYAIFVPMGTQYFRN